MMDEIREILKDNEVWLTSNEIAEKLGLKQKNISNQMTRLRRRGEVNFIYENRFKYGKLR